MAEGRELSTLLVDPGLDVSDPQLLGQGEGVDLVALRTPAASDANDYEFLHLRGKHFEQPTRVRPFLEDQTAVPGDGADEGDQGPGVGLDDLVLQLASAGVDHRDRAA
ncbi:MAG: hypothetical protein R3D98_09540 [Candidatus Krumholzibacteriia bacterium]